MEVVYNWGKRREREREVGWGENTQKTVVVKMRGKVVDRLVGNCRVVEKARNSRGISAEE